MRAVPNPEPGTARLHTYTAPDARARTEELRRIDTSIQLAHMARELMVAREDAAQARREADVWMAHAERAKARLADYLNG